MIEPRLLNARLLALAVAVALVVSAPATAWADLVAAGGLKSEDVAQVAYTKQTTKMSVANVGDRVVENGTYVIASSKDAQQLVGVAKGSKKNRAKATLQTESASLQSAQTWEITYDFYSASYVIANKKSGKILTAAGKAKPGADIVQMPKAKKTDKRQRWLITSTKTGYTITSAYNKNVNLAFSGKKMTLKKIGAASQQKFWLFDAANWEAASSVIKNGVYTLKSADDSSGQLLLTVPKSLSKPSVQLRLGTKEKGLNQMYRITAAKKASGYYSIQNISSSLYLTASGGKVLQQKYKGLKTQLWKPMVTSSGVMFVNRNGNALCVAGKAAASKSAVVSAKADEGSLLQQWVLSPTTTGLTYACERGLQKANARAAMREGYYRWSSFQYYYITADLTAFEFNIFKRTGLGQAWVPYKQWSIACGKNKCTTEADTIIYQHWDYHGDEKGYRAWYWSTIGGSGGATTAFHSQVCKPYSSTITDHRTKGYISQGCIRMSMEHAKWVYYNMPIGTFVSRYY